MPRRREAPIRRKNPSGKIVWVARWTDKTGKRRVGYPPDIPGTYAKKGPCKQGEQTCCAQHAIEACYELDERGPARQDTVGGYFETWIKRHPRSKVTNRTNAYRIEGVLDAKLDGIPLRYWPIDRLRKRQANDLVDYLLREKARSYAGAVNVLGSLHAMIEDARDDEVFGADRMNPFKVRIRRNDPRIQTAPRPVRVFSWQQMHAFARACAEADGPGGEAMAEWRRTYAEPMVRCLSDLGLRAGELLPLERGDLSFGDETLRVCRTVALGEVLDGTKTTHGLPREQQGRVVPVPPDLLRMLDRMPKWIGTRLLFPSPRGVVWRYQGWWRLVWVPGREASGLDIRPHEMRHSWVSLVRAAGVDSADAAMVAGHTEQTATARYSHALGRSFEAIRKAVGS